MQKFELNEFFQNIKLKKQYINKLKVEVTNLNLIKDTNLNNNTENNLVKYIVDITFSRTNTLLHVMDFSGNLKFYSSAGKLGYKGKSKKVRKLILRAIYKSLVLKLDYLLNQPIALHLKNVSFSSSSWIIDRLKKKLFIKVVKIYESNVYNGCRKRKLKKKKKSELKD
jgi:ribosomal protein S11